MIETLDPLAETPDSGKGETLFLHSGIYREQITVRILNLTFLGEEDGSSVITGGLSARMEAPEGGPLRTFRTWSCLIDTHDFTARRITFENSAGKGTEVGQAVALYADGDRLFFDACRFLGNQDTLFTAPLPSKEIEPGGFTGPKQNAPASAEGIIFPFLKQFRIVLGGIELAVAAVLIINQLIMLIPYGPEVPKFPIKSP